MNKTKNTILKYQKIRIILNKIENNTATKQEIDLANRFFNNFDKEFSKIKLFIYRFLIPKNKYDELISSINFIKEQKIKLNRITKNI